MKNKCLNYELRKDKFYTCRYDAAFKEVFMNEDNKDLLIYLLEHILFLKIEDVEYLNLERNVSNVNIKRKHFDLNLKTNIGYVQVEVNAYNADYINPRNMAYICDTYSHYVLKGEEYSIDKKIIQINFSYGIRNDDLYSIYEVCDKRGKRYVNNFLIYEFYMDNYLKLWYSNNEKAIDENKHIIMLDLELADLEKLSKEDKVVCSYMEELKRVNEKLEFREYMSAEEDNRKIENSLKSQWKREARAEGLAEGRAEGRTEGRVEGLAEGKLQSKREIIKNMFNEKMSISLISKIVELDEEEVRRIVSDI